MDVILLFSKTFEAGRGSSQLFKPQTTDRCACWCLSQASPHARTAADAIKTQFERLGRTSEASHDAKTRLPSSHFDREELLKSISRKEISGRCDDARGRSRVLSRVLILTHQCLWLEL